MAFTSRSPRDAKRYGPGEQVETNYRVRGDHAMRNIGIRQLTTPLPWLGIVRHHLKAAAPNRTRTRSLQRPLRVASV